MPSDPRLIRGPCFDCEDDCPCVEYVWSCDCHYFADTTEPTPKIDPETRPNVPPRMM
jgi:hypothetical protein